MTRQESRAATRADLVDAARRVFVERGYHGASLDLVAREAGYTKGAVYSAFGSKGQLFLAVYAREVERRWGAIEAEVAAAIASGERLDPGARSARDWFARMQAERDWLVVLLEFRLHAARDPELNAAYAIAHRHVVERLAGVLARTTGGDPDAALETAMTIVALGNGFALEHIVLPQDATEDRYVRASRALVRALLPSPDRRS